MVQIMTDEYLLDAISDENYKYYHEKHKIEKDMKKKTKKILGV